MQVESVNAVEDSSIQDKEIPKVSVCVVAYNQEKYIAKCLQSILDQKTNFKFEVIVGDDASKDKTAEIINLYQKKHPEIFTAIIRNENIGATANVFSIYAMARGKYIAHMDGDDFALPGKLQRQFDALEANPSCTICSHDIVRIEDGKEYFKPAFSTEGVLIKSLADLYRRLPFFAHSSKMFLNNKNYNYFSQFDVNAIDFEIHIEQARHGDIIHICDFLGGYNAFVGISYTDGVINPALPAAKRRVFEYAINNGCKGLARKEIVKLYAKSILSFAYQSARLGNFVQCRAFALESMRIKLNSPLQFLILFASYFPRLCNISANIYYRFTRGR